MPITPRGTLTSIALGLALGLALLWWGQRRLIYLPFGNVTPLASSGLLRAEEVSFTTDDRETLHGWFVPAASAPRYTVIVFNGNAGNRSFRTRLASSFARLGMSTLLFDYRGYGENAGSPSEDGLIRDARAARAYIASRADVDTSRIVFFGESLGAAVALRLATESRPFALILRSPFASLTDVGRHHYPFLPVRWMLRDRYASIDLAGKVSCPTLVIAGDRDRIVPADHSRRLYEAIKTEKKLVVIAGADHNDEALLDSPALLQTLQSFLSAVDRR